MHRSTRRSGRTIAADVHGVGERLRRAIGAGVAPSIDPRVSRRVAVLVWLGFVVGFVVALVAIARPRWFPILDLAQTEMRLRDVFTAHPPLIGLPGRIGTLPASG